MPGIRILPLSPDYSSKPVAHSSPEPGEECGRVLVGSLPYMRGDTKLNLEGCDSWRKQMRCDPIRAIALLIFPCSTAAQGFREVLFISAFRCRKLQTHQNPERG